MNRGRNFAGGVEFAQLTRGGSGPDPIDGFPLEFLFRMIPPEDSEPTQQRTDGESLHQQGEQDDAGHQGQQFLPSRMPGTHPVAGNNPEHERDRNGSPKP